MRTCLLQTHSAANDSLFRLTLPNHAAYADAHGYDMIHLHRTYDEIWWGMEDYVLAQLPHYDRILTVGSDVIFTNMDVPLSNFDDGRHCVFIQDEGLGYPTLNFDLVLWTKAEDVRHVIARLRATRPLYEKQRFGLQTGITMLAEDPAMESFIKVYQPRVMQSAPFVDMPGSWRPGDFSLHFLGLTNEMKFEGCHRFLCDGEVLWWRRSLDWANK